MHHPLTLSRLPTPVEPLDVLSERWGIDLWVKRDDLTGFGLSGNKVRKLDFLLEQAVRSGADTVLTCGGLQSNHCRATALAARRLGLRPVLLLRGERPEVADSNLLLDELLGAEIHTCTAEDYREHRNALLRQLAAEVERDGGNPYIIPEGGSNALGALGFVRASEELEAQIESPFDAVFVAVGSGGTLAGLAMGAHIGPVTGVAVCDDQAYFRDAVTRIAEGVPTLETWALREGPRKLPPPGPFTWDVLEGYQGPGYALATPELWQLIAEVAQAEGLLLDPVYTGKAMLALREEVRAGRVSGRVLFWHTGGAFGLFGRGAEVAPA